MNPEFSQHTQFHWVSNELLGRQFEPPRVCFSTLLEKGIYILIPQPLHRSMHIGDPYYKLIKKPQE
jgi:hypothetical protein